MTNRTPGTAKAKRCTATEGAQQCLKEQHPKVVNHTWGKPGETKVWNDDGTPKVAAVEADTIVVDQPGEGFGVDSSGTDPDSGTYYPAAGPIVLPPPAPDAHHSDYFNGDNVPAAQPPATAGPPGHSFGDVAANSAMDSVLFDHFDPELQNEMVWSRIAANSLLRMGAEFHRHGKVADAGLLMALRDQVEQLVANRGLPGGAS